MNLTLIILPIMLIVYGAIIYLFVLLVKALRKYIKSKDVREEKKAVCRSLGEALKAHRTEKQMLLLLQAEWEFPGTGNPGKQSGKLLRMTGLRFHLPRALTLAS